jgi:hypothetical protein
MRRDGGTRRLRAYRGSHVVLIVVVGAALAGCGASDQATPEDRFSEAVAVSTRDGKVKGVGIGDWPAEVKRVFGPPSDTTGYFP